MKLVTPSLAVEDSDGFKKDELNRQYFGDALLNLISNSSDELVISLDGKWGEGKTTFIKMLQGLLKENGIPSIYIDAFQNDYTEDAFISIASAITSYSELHAAESEKSSDFKNKATKVGIRLLSLSAKIGFKAATLGVIKESDIENLSKIADDVATDTSEIIADIVRERLSSHNKETELIQSFRESLSELPKSLKDNNSGRLVIIIDELDRCKPSFAVEVLEKIKHLFSVKNVFFLLVMNKQQLEETIRSVYGRKIDAHTYLQKFINIETSIPKRINDPDKNDFEPYIKRLLQLHEISTRGDDSDILDCLVLLSQHFNLSLRQLEKVFTNMAIIYSSIGKNGFRLAPIIVFTSVIKVVNPNMFENIMLGKISYSALIEQLEFSRPKINDKNYSVYNWIMELIQYSMLTESEFNYLDEDNSIKELRYSLSEKGYRQDRKMLIPNFCKKLNMFTAN